MLTGARLSAERAYALGLSPLAPVEPAELLAVATGIAQEVAARGPRAHAAILRVLRAGAPAATELALETALAAIATAGAEAAEGIAAFKGRRKASFEPRAEPEREVSDVRGNPGTRSGSLPRRRAGSR